MICLRSGYCCTNYDVIVIDPKAIQDGEVDLSDKSVYLHKPTGEKCPHLIHEEDGLFKCGIHHLPWYKETPCFAYTQIENGNTECRMGAYLRKNQEVIKMDQAMKDWIDNASMEDLLRKQRYAPLGDPLFQGEIGQYYAQKMGEKRKEVGPEEYTAASKRIGWG